MTIWALALTSYHMAFSPLTESLEHGIEPSTVKSNLLPLARDNKEHSDRLKIGTDQDTSTWQLVPSCSSTHGSQKITNNTSNACLIEVSEIMAVCCCSAINITIHALRYCRHHLILQPHPNVLTYSSQCFELWEEASGVAYLWSSTMRSQDKRSRVFSSTPIDGARRLRHISSHRSHRNISIRINGSTCCVYGRTTQSNTSQRVTSCQATSTCS